MLYFEGKASILLYCVVSVVLICILLAVSYLVQKLQPSAEKSSIYECGFKPFDFFTFPFDIQFYRIGALFLLFDVEVLFLFPWALHFYQIPLTGHYAVFCFLFLLLAGFIYELATDALAWYPKIWYLKVE